jgi:DNA (cytosine-5)-methyltransferase 1
MSGTKIMIFLMFMLKPYRPIAIPRSHGMRMIDLFAGTGGFTNAFQRSGTQCVYANDYAPESETIYNYNFDHDLTMGDLNDIVVEDIPDHDILTGGFPCQPFSIAGQRKGFDDQRSNVFWKILEILQFHAPRYIVLENVKNLVTHDNGNTFQVITENLKECGYALCYKVLDTSKITHIPQHRERIYIVGLKCNNDEEGEFFEENFNLDFAEKQNLPLSHFLEKPENIDKKYYYSKKYAVWTAIKSAVVKENTIYQYRRTSVRENKNGVVPTLTANMGAGGHNVPLLKDSRGIRKLTPRECFNFQGFDHEYEFPDTLSDSKLYKLAGNAITTTIAEMVAKRISEFNVALEVDGFLDQFSDLAIED